VSGGGGQSGGSSVTKTGLPGWERPAQKGYLASLLGQVFPNGIGNGLAPYNPALNQQVAPFTDAQNQALALGQSQTQGAQGLANLSANQNAYYASGMANNPSTNPNLQAYANAAAIPYTQNYMQSVQPALQAREQQSGTLNSSGAAQEQANAQNQFAQGLATLNANIYEPAYQLGTQEQMSAIQGMPGQVQGLYNPTQALYGLGSAQQNQQQNVFNAGTANAQNQTNWPFNLLSQLGAGLGIAGGGGGTTTSTTMPGGGGLFGK
jgi:hypothetical protein